MYVVLELVPQSLDLLSQLPSQPGTVHVFTWFAESDGSLDSLIAGPVFVRLDVFSASVLATLMFFFNTFPSESTMLNPSSSIEHSC